MHGARTSLRGLVLAACGALASCAFWDMGDWSDAHGTGSADAALDAAADGGPLADAGRFCAEGIGARGAVFCEDFDDPTADAGWTRAVLSNGGFLGAAQDPASPPGALLADAPQQGAAYLRRDAVGAVDRFRYEAKVRVDRSDDAGAYLLQHELVLPDGVASVRLATYEDTASLGQAIRLDGSAERNLNERLPSALPFGRWVALVLDVDLARRPATATLAVDGRVVIDRLPLDPVFVPAPVQSTTGITYVRTSANRGARWLVAVDDVRWSTE